MNQHNWMDLHNNNVGKIVFRKHAKDRCRLRIFNRCILRAGCSANMDKVAKELKTKIF